MLDGSDMTAQSFISRKLKGYCALCEYDVEIS